MDVQTDSWLGSVLSNGRYHIVRTLGAGGMGSVFLARDTTLDSDVVLKVPHAHLLRDADCIRRFQLEIRSLVKLAHPHIVHITDVGDRDGQPFAVMQYLGGGSLDERRDAKGRVPVGHLSGWLPQVASALDFIHRQGFVHRDVKPANILFDEHGFPFLGDFGVAKALEATADNEASAKLTGTGFILGTPHYMSPELVMGTACDGRVDQYALAVMIHQMLTGKFPIDAPNATALLVAHTAAPPVPLHEALPGVPAPLAAAVLRGLSKSPDDRFATCKDLADAVVGALGRGGAANGSVATEARVQRLRCPHCGKHLKLGSRQSAELLQKTVRCQACTQPFRVTESCFEALSRSQAETVSSATMQETVSAPKPVLAKRNELEIDLAGLELPTTAALPSLRRPEQKPPQNYVLYVGLAIGGGITFLGAMVVMAFLSRGGSSENASHVVADVAEPSASALLDSEPTAPDDQLPQPNEATRPSAESTDIVSTDTSSPSMTGEAPSASDDDAQPSGDSSPETGGEGVVASDSSPHDHSESGVEPDRTPRKRSAPSRRRPETEYDIADEPTPPERSGPLRHVELPSGRELDIDRLFTFDVKASRSRAEDDEQSLVLEDSNGNASAWVAQKQGGLDGPAVLLDSSGDPFIAGDFDGPARRRGQLLAWDGDGVPLYFADYAPNGNLHGLRGYLDDGDLRLLQEYEFGKLVATHVFQDGELATTVGEGQAVAPEHQPLVATIDGFDKTLVEEQRALHAEVRDLYKQYKADLAKQKSREAKRNIIRRDGARARDSERAMKEMQKRAWGR